MGLILEARMVLVQTHHFVRDTKTLIGPRTSDGNVQYDDKPIESSTEDFDKKTFDEVFTTTVSDRTLNHFVYCFIGINFM